MFLSRNVNRLPCRSICRTLLTNQTSKSENIHNPVISHLIQTNNEDKNALNGSSSGLKFNHNQISLDFGIVHRGGIRKEIVDPFIRKKIIENPVSIINEIDEIYRRIGDLRLPDVGKKNVDDRGMQAANKKDNRPLGIMIIRRKKMKKHKRKKLWKRMRFEWAKRRQRREFRKEKAFQAELLAQIKEAEKFSAEEYVEEKINKATEVPLPRYWKGKRLPAFIIRDLIEKEKRLKEQNQQRLERVEKYRHMKL
uniref:CSON010957 protein n=1 Tax=Culicoides sonorensis TaxID=179676 RepID=A0A336LR08_CULSO